jgi:hypothetical protein
MYKGIRKRENLQDIIVWTLEYFPILRVAGHKVYSFPIAKKLNWCYKQVREGIIEALRSYVKKHDFPR